MEVKSVATSYLICSILAGTLTAANFSNSMDAELVGHALRVDRLALVDERRVARDHEQLAEAPTQIGRSVV
jgi:hypothetical protein